uniref:Uncharacterized protein LOC104233129 n=1 Tax=Nicotiana sylvestris TaxID=4096 RepID=A0A1U7X4Y6_NICSY|nr:PREDICTED: uncharacterized protein LOC104233129 [Nicotiana sylvestris]
MTNTSTGIMESWFTIVVTFCISFFLILLFNLFFQKTKKLPPGPFIFPVIGMLPLLRKTGRDLELMLRDLKCKYGPIIAIKIGYSSPSIVISSHLLAYQALVQQGAICSDRPIASTASKISTLTNGQQHQALMVPRGGSFIETSSQKCSIPLASSSPTPRTELGYLAYSYKGSFFLMNQPHLILPRKRSCYLIILSMPSSVSLSSPALGISSMSFKYRKLKTHNIEHLKVFTVLEY